MPSRTIDFDAFRSEKKAEPVELRLGGKTYELPPSMPASLALDVLRMAEEQDAGADVKLEDLITVGAAIFGSSDAFRTMMEESHLQLDELPDLISQIVETYTQVQDPNPESPAQTSTSASSATGPSSRPTSDASTESTSPES